MRDLRRSTSATTDVSRPDHSVRDCLTLGTAEMRHAYDVGGPGHEVKRVQAESLARVVLAGGSTWHAGASLVRRPASGLDETAGVTDRRDRPDDVSRSEYVLGHSEAELRRLAFNAKLLEPITRQMLVDAGIRPGMRVLDVGTGRGDVAFLAAELVGEGGSVVGIDRAPDAIRAARGRAADRSGGDVTFEEGDPAELTFASPFDAVVGRYVLQFQPEPARMLRRLATHLRPRGIVAFHEIDWTGHRSVPPVTLWDRCCSLVVQLLSASGADVQSGARMPSAFVAAGLPAPSVRITTLAGAGANSEAVIQRLSNFVVSVLPELEERGLVAHADLDASTLTARLADAVRETASFVVAGSEVTASTRRA